MPSKRRTLSKANFLLVRVLAAIGVCISGYLLVLKLTGKITSLVGCGGESGCANVLGSKWSAWVHIPVSGLAMIFYFVIIALTFNRSRSLLVTSALALIGAALWFMAIMTFVLEEFCPWCLTTHITGVLTAIAILCTTRRTQDISWISCTILALAPLSVLIGGQIWGPEPATHAISENTAAAKNVPVHERKDERVLKNIAEEIKPADALLKNGRKLSYGGKIFELSAVPFVGPPDAKHVLVKYFDYTCGSCRNMEEDLEKLMEKHPEDFAVILLPTPLNRKCNAHMKAGVKDHPWACELAKLGMAAWRAQPESFPEVHKILFSRPILSTSEAQRRITEIIPKEQFSKALNDPWINELIAANTADYQLLAAKSIVMPKLLLVDTKVLHGVSRSSEIFVREMEKFFGL